MMLKKWETGGKWLGVVFLVGLWVLAVEAFCWAFFSSLALRSLIGVSVLSGAILLWMVGVLGLLTRAEKASQNGALKKAFLQGQELSSSIDPDLN